MYINTRTKETMIQSLNEIFDISIAELNELFFKAKKLAITDSYVDGDKLNQVINEFIEFKNFNRSIEQLLFFHLGRRLNSDGNSVEGKNLFELLSNKSALSFFLKSHGVTFQISDHHLNIFYKGNLVPLVDSENNDVHYLRWRLGHEFDAFDYCFNGFMLKDQLIRNDYTQSLFHAPEFIRFLAKFLGNRSIKTDYVEKSKFYCFEYLAPIEKVIFDENENFSKEEKQKYLLNRVLYRLFQYSRRSIIMFDNDNPALRLDDNDKMEARYFVKKEEITWELL